MRGDYDRRYSRIYRVSTFYYLKGLIMAQLLAVALYFGVFVAWVSGVAHFVAMQEWFWAVFCFSFFPAGVVVGLYNFIFFL